MTGYGCATAVHRLVRADVTIHAINRKHLDILINLPPDWTALESLAHKMTSERIARGRVQIQIEFAPAEQGEGAQHLFKIDRALAHAYLRELREVQQELGLAGEISVDALLTMPGLFRQESPALNADDAREALVVAMSKALDDLVAMRESEGRALRSDIEHRFNLMLQTIADMATLREDVVKRYQQALRERIALLGAPIDLSDERLLREVAIFADRSDIAEEITRLHSHLHQAKSVLDSKEPAGRTLEFLLQEILREINTIGSKANDARLSKLVVEAKSETDRIREQIQNLE